MGIITLQLLKRMLKLKMLVNLPKATQLARRRPGVCKGHVFVCVILFSIIRFPRTLFATPEAKDFWRSSNVFSGSVRMLSSFRAPLLCLNFRDFGLENGAHLQGAASLP